MLSRAFIVLAAAGLIAATVTPASAAGDAEAGKKVFNKCAACHSIEPGKTRVGPSLFGVVGRKAGTLEGYSYSSAMKGSGLTWDEATLNTYLENPQGVVKGTKMTFLGVKDPTERANVIAYLETLK
jgi:cytochrome c